MAFKPETKFQVVRFNADAVPFPEELRCVRVFIPDDVAYLRVLAAVCAQMTQATNWEGEQSNRDAAAQLCLNGYVETAWDICVDCDDVADCIETSEAVQEQINRLIALGSGIPATSPYTDPLSEERLNQDLSTAYNPTCDYDILWSQCTGVVDLTNLAIVEVLQKIEAATNTVELINAALGTIPAVAGAEKAVGIDGALSLINYYQEAIEQEYTAQYTEIPVTGTRDLIAFALFCACKADCVITIDKIQRVMQKRLEDFIEVGDIFTFTNLLAFLEGAEADTEIVVDLTFFAAWKMVAVANYLFGNGANHIIDVIIKEMADEPDNGWSLMGDCPACGITWIVDIGTTDGDDIISADTALVERLDIPPAEAYARRIQLTFASPITTLELGWNTDGALDDMFIAGEGLEAETLAHPSGSTLVEFSEPVTVVIIDLGYSGSSGAYATNLARITIVDACE